MLTFLVIVVLVVLGVGCAAVAINAWNHSNLFGFCGAVVMWDCATTFFGGACRIVWEAVVDSLNN